MRARALTSTALVAALALGAGSLATAGAAEPRATAAGTPGIGDPYFPLDGNGGYDVDHYGLNVRYDPASDQLRGVARIQATSTQRLTRLNLDLVGLTVREILVDGVAATWTRGPHELRVTPARALPEGEAFTVKVTYDGVPRRLEGAGFIATDDGFVMAGQPHVAASWFPVNDHPTDKATYTFRVTVPTGREVVANGLLVGQRTSGAWTTWTWDAPDPMASYLVTVDVGDWDTTAYQVGRTRIYDAIDPDLFAGRLVPPTGRRFAVSQQADNSYKRLTRRIAVPADGATVGFTVVGDTEPNFDYLFVEAHTVGQDDWTTLRDQLGHTTQATGGSCTVWPDLHPFITEHYQSVDTSTGRCTPTGATGTWWARSGAGDGAEQWLVDLADYAGSTVELSIAYVSDQGIQERGVAVDDIVVSTGEGSTSFERDTGGWAVSGPPPGSPANANDWLIGTAADGPPTTGDIAAGSLARQPEILRFLGAQFGPYPFRDAGGIVDDVTGLGFALETQTRPIYSKAFFTDSVSGDSVVVHELAHQWYGDSLAVHRWSDIWLNEGFATYAEWLWAEDQGFETAQQTFDYFYNDFIPADDPQWQVVIGDPGADDLFAYPVYFRGAMTLQVLRNTVGDDAFFRILKGWARTRAGGNVAIPEFIAYAERISGRQLDDLFTDWLYTAGRPDLGATLATSWPTPITVAAKATLRSARLEHQH